MEINHFSSRHAHRHNRRAEGGESSWKIETDKGQTSLAKKLKAKELFPKLFATFFCYPRAKHSPPTPHPNQLY